METQKFNQIYSSHKQEVEKYVKLKVYPHTEIADEIVSDVFLKVYEHLNSGDPKHRFDPSKSKLSTWIFTIANNTLIDYFRSIKLEKKCKSNYMDDKHQTDAIYNLNSDSTTDGAIIYSESMNALMKAIKKLDANMQKIAELRYFKQYQYKEIAAELNMPMGTVKVNINRIKDFLVKHTVLA